MKRLFGMDDQGIVNPLQAFDKVLKYIPTPMKSHPHEANEEDKEDDRGL